MTLFSIYLGIAFLTAAVSFIEDVNEHEIVDNLIASLLTGLIWPVIVWHKIIG
jgi:hypothetical protein